jgi:hypothetical protein
MGAQLKLAIFYNGEVIEGVAPYEVMCWIFTCDHLEPSPLPGG